MLYLRQYLALIAGAHSGSVVRAGGLKYKYNTVRRITLRALGLRVGQLRPHPEDEAG